MAARADASQTAGCPFLDLDFSRYSNRFSGRHAFGHRGPTMSCVMLIGVRGTHIFIASSG